ncbi:MAG: NUDIX domain-containing protein [Saprospirales bacterium]|nr:NUDIX domain-containing protein [Saprospirales bacterium]
MPKGKMEIDETIEDTAIREVEEETGLTNVMILKANFI